MPNQVRLLPGVVVLTSRGYQYVENLDPNQDRLVCLDPWTHEVSHHAIVDFRTREADLRQNWLSPRPVSDPTPFLPITRVVCESHGQLVAVPVRIVTDHVQIAFLDRIPDSALGCSVVTFPALPETWYRIQSMNFNHLKRLLNSGEPVDGISPLVIHKQLNGHPRSRFFIGLLRSSWGDREWLLIRHGRNSDTVSFTFRSLEDGFNFRSLFAPRYRTNLLASRDGRYLKTVVVTVYRRDVFSEEAQDYRLYPVRTNYSQRFPATEITITTEAPFLVVNSYFVCAEKI